MSPDAVDRRVRAQGGDRGRLRHHEARRAPVERRAARGSRTMTSTIARPPGQPLAGAELRGGDGDGGVAGGERAADAMRAEGQAEVRLRADLDLHLAGGRRTRASSAAPSASDARSDAEAQRPVAARRPEHGCARAARTGTPSNPSTSAWPRSRRVGEEPLARVRERHHAPAAVASGPRAPDAPPRAGARRRAPRTCRSGRRGRPRAAARDRSPR